MSTVHVTVVSTATTRGLARATVRHARAALPSSLVHVLDLDGTYRGVADEEILTPAGLGIASRVLNRRLAAHGTRRAGTSLEPSLVASVLRREAAEDDATVLALRPGMLLLQRPARLLDTSADVVLVARCAGGDLDPLGSGDWPGTADVRDAGAFSPALLALRGSPDAVIGSWELAVGTADASDAHWLDVAAARSDVAVVRDAAALVSVWNLTPAHRLEARADGGLLLDGHAVEALDLSCWDPAHPWLLDANAPRAPRARLSDHPVLAAYVTAISDEIAADASEPEQAQPGDQRQLTSLGIPLDAPMRHLYRTAPDSEPVPDPFDPSEAEDLRAWLTGPGPGGVPRYLGAVHATRADLRQAFPRVPGPDVTRLLDWGHRHAAAEGYAPELVAASPGPGPAAARWRRARPAHGVTVAGFLAGGMGLAESARQLVAALDAAGVRHAEHTVQGYVPARSDVVPTTTGVALDTTVLCVNADLAPAVSAELPPDIARAYRIGMWYWEVEDFPASQHGGFHAVDEVWVATRFVHDAIAPHSPVPVRTVMPPLPQRGPEPAVTRADLGFDERPYLLFTFDFLSTAERKNPWGLVEAYRQAFAPGDGPLLVIKSINADLRPSDAERLRLAAAGRPDVVLVERFLPAAERDALVAHCLAYVSLHRSEGLGLTIAEAMAWGKPVVATAYSGNLDFMTEENSFLVPWSPAVIPPDAPPYPAGGRWAEPDLAAAAAILRRLVTDPDEAAARGARAALDIAGLHSPEAAGRAIAARLAELAPARRAKARRLGMQRVRHTAAAIRDTLR